MTYPGFDKLYKTFGDWLSPTSAADGTPFGFITALMDSSPLCRSVAGRDVRSHAGAVRHTWRQEYAAYHYFALGFSPSPDTIM